VNAFARRRYARERFGRAKEGGRKFRFESRDLQLCKEDRTARVKLIPVAETRLLRAKIEVLEVEKRSK